MLSIVLPKLVLIRLRGACYPPPGISMAQKVENRSQKGRDDSPFFFFLSFQFKRTLIDELGISIDLSIYTKPPKKKGQAGGQDADDLLPSANIMARLKGNEKRKALLSKVELGKRVR